MATPRDIAHLMRRAGFGASASEAAALTSQSFEQLVDGLLGATPAAVVAPAILSNASKARWEKHQALQRWWYDRMAFSATPLQEKLTLFWHGIFTTEFSKLYSARQIWDQHLLYRQHCLGNLRDFAKAMAVQPAMLNYLDNASNVAGQAQENFARELWELFLLGPGHYSQDEIVASARAWTGHTTVNGGSTDGLEDRFVYAYRDDLHDHGNKTIFGSTRDFDGPDVIDWTLDGPQRMNCARFIVTKLWTFLAYPNPEESVVAALANVLASGWDIRATLRALLLRPEFLSTRAFAGLPRSPSEFIAASLKATGISAEDAQPQWFAARMGQDLFNPPDVAGWRAGGAWVSGSAFFGRARFADHFSWIANDRGILNDTTSMSVENAVQHAFDLFGLIDVSSTTRSTIENWLRNERDHGGWPTRRYLMTLILLSPEFQVA
ncbi:MAG: DUF1800 family protein [Acidimicrobiia bacterium]